MKSANALTRLRGCMVFTGRLCEKYHNLAASRENLSSGFLTGRDSDLSHQLQRLARKLKFHL